MEGLDSKRGPPLPVKPSLQVDIIQPAAAFSKAHLEQYPEELDKKHLDTLLGLAPPKCASRAVTLICCLPAQFIARAQLFIVTTVL